MSLPGHEEEQFIQYRELRQVFRPLITAGFRHDGVAYEHLMLVDTGADSIVLPHSLMSLFGIVEEDCWRVSGQTFYGNQPGYRSPFEIEVGFPEFSAAGAFRSAIVFSPALENFGYGLLGREPTFDHLSCRFGNREGYGFWIRLY